MQQQSDLDLCQKLPPDGLSSVLSSCNPESVESPDRYKTELCRSFEESEKCRYGNKCRFAHGRDELRPLERHPKYKTEFCRTYHTSGFCPYGQRCHFIHSSLGSLSGGDGVISMSTPRSTALVPPMLDPVYEDWKEGQKQTNEPERRFTRQASEVERLFSTRVELDGNLTEPDPTRMRDAVEWLERVRFKAGLRFVEQERRSIELALKLADQKRRILDLERKSDRPERPLSRPEETCDLEPRRLELELSSILQRRRRQFRCDSVGSSCETPPPFVSALDSFTSSRTSSPMSDETRSPSIVASPFSLLSPDIPQPSSTRQVMFSKRVKGCAGFPTNLNTWLGLYPLQCALQGLDSAPTSPWSLNDTLVPCSAKGVYPPHLNQLGKTSATARQSPPTFFLFDTDALTQLIPR